MHMFKERCSALLIFLGFVFGAEAHEQESLKTNEIHHIMDQIFSEHVNKKEISDQILHHAFLIYIDQFDPHGIYLLESEVAPYVKLTPAGSIRRSNNTKLMISLPLKSSIPSSKALSYVQGKSGKDWNRK